MFMTTLLETERGRRWLSNFYPEDEKIAAALLRRVVVVSREKIFMEIKRKISEIIDEEKILTPTLLIPARSSDFLREKKSIKILFEDYSTKHPISPTPGSEGTIGNLVRDMCEKEKRKLINPSDVECIDDLRRKSVRSIVIVTDYIGSGEEAKNNIISIVKNKTIRSWMSYGLVKIYIVCYAINSTTFRLLSSRKLAVDDFFKIEKIDTIKEEDNTWTPDLRRKGERLCVSETYINKKDRGRSDLLGYKRSGGLFVSNNRVPNNIPYILRMESGNAFGKAKWNPLFEGRFFPYDLQIELGYLKKEDVELDKILKSIDALDPSKILKGKGGRLGIDKLVLVLRSLDSMSSKEHSYISPHTDKKSMEYAINFLKEMGLITEKNKLTSSGLRELGRFKEPLSEELDRRYDLYYPHSMR